ncbi:MULTISPECIES: isobutyryl-CoA dehydrogenase [Asticcacaulis]|uniref:isobutyryl-CoA dehydrogenase n=1 Tax=Asticcacaulis TaxID=76890 RepID=UPI001AE3B2E0|nr:MULTISPECIES: isobutyryl-CoA dehydrogenase [Asticcacaulis]MBP2161533.1 alkylation response protein AidB-like acyl-CoA dehydrogenase [Asticcacaulis solisilvae]MDR6802616.1 alkylation response protein AidB-like acyl-CoA dehydrogenase [Asticcacaulis sp. BE141]
MILNEDQLLIQETAKRFAYDRLRPNAGDWDERKHFPVDVMREAAGLGFASIYTREDHGGSGLTRLDAVLIFEQLSRGCIATAAFLSIHNMCTWMIDSFGSEDQRAHWLPQLVGMDAIASYCLTEPGSGSDAAALATRAVRDGDGYVLNGSKQFISGAGVSDVYIVMARTGEDGPKGISAFIIPKDSQGLSFGANEKKMGWNAQPTRQVLFDNVRIPAESRLGEEGQGFTFAMKGLDGGRLNIAACSLGGAQDALDRARDYAGQRKQFGKTLDAFQATQFKLADMETELQAARSLLYDAAQKLDAKAPDATKWCAMAKRFVTDTGSKVANEALQIHGGYGYLHDYGVERIVRDLRVHQILEGTNEIMRVIIARHMETA